MGEAQPTRGLKTRCPQFAETSLWACRVSTSCHMLQRQKNSPSRLRFRPSLPGTFGLPPCGFALQPSGATSTYSRSVLGARANLDGRDAADKGSENALSAICGDFSLDMPS